MSDLAEYALVSRPRLTVRVQRLDDEGLVERHKCPTDARSTMVTLTELGMKRLREAAPVHVAGVRRYFIEPIGAEQLCAVSQPAPRRAVRPRRSRGSAANGDTDGTSVATWKTDRHGSSERPG